MRTFSSHQGVWTGPVLPDPSGAVRSAGRPEERQAAADGSRAVHPQL
ncbi:hypothetical protein KPATCC21470_4426 [Kitasatospora purpeofusca]